MTRPGHADLVKWRSCGLTPPPGALSSRPRPPSGQGDLSTQGPLYEPSPTADPKGRPADPRGPVVGGGQPGGEGAGDLWGLFRLPSVKKSVFGYNSPSDTSNLTLGGIAEAGSEYLPPHTVLDAPQPPPLPLPARNKTFLWHLLPVSALKLLDAQRE